MRYFSSIFTKGARVLCLLLAACLTLALAACAGADKEPEQPESVVIVEPETGGEETPEVPEDYDGYVALPLPEEMRAMYVSFPDWNECDLATDSAFRETVVDMFQNCAEMGLNTVIVHVRPFSDAFYPSEIYPWSHQITGFQGLDPGFDPLAIMLEEAHARGLRFEAYINPFRVKNEQIEYEALAEDNPAVQNPSWAKSVGNYMWYDPGVPDVRQMIADGVQEIVENYNVDGIHFDDYFYPEYTAEQLADGLDETFDAESYELYGEGADRDAWRRSNINKMVGAVYDTVKAANPTVSFGISPQGNNENNYNKMHADVREWMANPGYVDYIMPQLYWGFDWNVNGATFAAFGNITAEWASYAIVDGVKLYAALGAYNVVRGTDGSGENSGEWESGHILADQVSYLRSDTPFSGFALFRYGSLYFDGADTAGEEISSLAALL